MAATDLHTHAVSNPAEDYGAFAHEAHALIELLIQTSLTHAKEVIGESDTQRGRFIELENEARTAKHEVVQWPKISEFTSEKVGVGKIKEYVEKEWKTAPGGHDLCWLYAVDFVEKKSREFNDLYIYRLRYSIPTRRQPIPRQTASIYFTIDVSKVKSKSQRVQVLFAIETMRVVHQPDQFRFRQTWLQDVILLKEKMARGIDF